MTLSQQLDLIYAKAIGLDEIQAWIVQNEMTQGFPDGSQVTTVVIALLTELKSLRAVQTNGKGKTVAAKTGG